MNEKTILLTAYGDVMNNDIIADMIQDIQYENGAPKQVGNGTQSEGILRDCETS